MSRISLLLLTCVFLPACESDAPTAPVDTVQVVDLDGDGYDDGDMQFLLDLLANNPEFDVDPLRLGRQEWEGGRLVRLQLGVHYPHYYSPLTGPFPGSVGFLTEIRWLEIYQLNLHGPLPPSIAKLQKVERLILHEVGIEGEIPEALGLLPRLRWLSLARNRLSGTLPASVASMPLGSLALHRNQLQSPIPPLNTERLEGLYIGNPGIEGNLFDFLPPAPELKSLYVVDTSLEGDFFAHIDDFPKLERLTLNDNQFTGTVPARVFTDWHMWRMDIRRNRFGGQIPDEACLPRPGWSAFQFTANAFCPPFPDCMEGREDVSLQDCPPQAP